jgi:hypothetical protein
VVVRPPLDYAPAALTRESRRRRLRAIAAAAEVVAVAGTALAVLCAIGGARDYLGTFGGCATGRGEAVRQVRLYTPILFSLPVAGWVLAQRAGLSVLPCRCCLWAALAAWLAALFITYR